MRTFDFHIIRDLTVAGYDVVNWIQLDQKNVQWTAFVIVRFALRGRRISSPSFRISLSQEHLCSMGKFSSTNTFFLQHLHS